MQRNALRTALTAVGVFWGVLLLIVMVGFGNGLESGTRASMSGLVTNSMYIWGQRTSVPFRGQSPGRFVKLTMDDLTCDYAGVYLEVSRNHNRDNRRRVPLQDKVCRALNNYLQVRPQTPNTNCFFLNQEGQPISKRTVQRIIADCAKAAGLVGVSAQSMRRTFARQLLLETQNLSLVSEQLGHQNRNITEHYLANHKDDH